MQIHLTREERRKSRKGQGGKIDWSGLEGISEYDRTFLRKCEAKNPRLFELHLETIRKRPHCHHPVHLEIDRLK